MQCVLSKTTTHTIPASQLTNNSLHTRNPRLMPDHEFVHTCRHETSAHMHPIILLEHSSNHVKQNTLLSTEGYQWNRFFLNPVLRRGLQFLLCEHHIFIIHCQGLPSCNPLLVHLFDLPARGFRFIRVGCLAADTAARRYSFAFTRFSLEDIFCV